MTRRWARPPGCGTHVHVYTNPTYMPGCDMPPTDGKGRLPRHEGRPRESRFGHRNGSRGWLGGGVADIKLAGGPTSVDTVVLALLCKPQSFSKLGVPFSRGGGDGGLDLTCPWPGEMLNCESTTDGRGCSLYVCQLSVVGLTSNVISLNRKRSPTLHLHRTMTPCSPESQLPPSRTSADDRQ